MSKETARRSPIVRHLLGKALPFLQAIASCVMAWKAVCLLANTPYPAMVVRTRSMEPAFQRGDIILVTNRNGPSVRVGDLPICKVPGRQYPMVHRIVQVHHQDTELGPSYEPLHFRSRVYRSQLMSCSQLILTKGDNNVVTDESLYPVGQDYLRRDQIVGFVRMYIPSMGWIVLALQDPSMVWQVLASSKTRSIPE